MATVVRKCFRYAAHNEDLRTKRELIVLLSFTCNYVVSVRKGFLFLLVLVIGCVILLWHSLGLLYNYSDHSWRKTDGA